MKNRLLFSIILVVFIDLLGFSLILPLLPYYAETFKANSFVTGLLVASYAAAQLVGAPLLGRLSDRYGRRPILIASIFGTFLGFLLLGFAKSLAMLFAARILDGLTGGNLSIAQAYITDVTEAKDRSRGLGMIGAAFGLGFIIGPVTGGFLSQWGYAVPALVAAALSFINLVLISAWLPESLTGRKTRGYEGQETYSYIGRIITGTGSSLYWIAAYHKILLRTGVCDFSNHILALYLIQVQSQCARYGIDPHVRWHSFRHRAGISRRAPQQQIP